MSFRTNNELNHFDFEDATVMEISRGLGCWHIVISDVHILPENSVNRDIRVMRTNDLDLQLLGAALDAVVEEGYSLLDVDEKPYKTIPDRTVPAGDYEKTFEHLAGGHIDSVEKNDKGYIIFMRDEDHTWRLEFTGEHDREEWEKFMAL